MKIVLVLGSLIAIVLIIGALLPKTHIATRSAIVEHDPATVYAAIRDVVHAPEWRADVHRVELISPTRFREHAKHGAVTYDIIADEPPRRFVTRIADTNLGYAGSWAYVLEPVENGTRITITENGEVTNLLFRVLSRFVFGHTATIDKYLAALQNRRSWPQPSPRPPSGR